LLFIKHVLRIPLRMSEEDLLLGDDAAHGEAAYVFGPCEAHDRETGYIQGEMIRHESTNDAELGLGGVTAGRGYAAEHEEKNGKNGESSVGAL
jgi:Amt family ammonium transporter